MSRYERNKIINENFYRNVLENNFPPAKSKTTWQDANLTSEEFIDLFHTQLISRHLDFAARRLKEAKHGYYTIGSSGHEGNAALAKVLQISDPAFLHYRGTAFMLQRAKQAYGEADIVNHLLAMIASRDDPCSGGRHKVLGSLELNVPPQTSTIASHLPKAVGAAFALSMQRGNKQQTSIDKVIFCSFGDASFNHASAQSAFNTARWLRHNHYPLPILFVCEDNGLGISVKTPATWIKQAASGFKPIQYIAADGLNIADIILQGNKAVAMAKHQQQPVFLHLSLVRLMGHAGNDFEWQYNTWDDIEEAECNDPLLHSARQLIENNLLTPKEVIQLYDTAAAEVAEQQAIALEHGPLRDKKDVTSALLPHNKPHYRQNTVTEEQRKTCFADVYEHLDQPKGLCLNINLALTDLMLQYPDICVFGEDVGKKGGVYRVSQDLQTRFGQRRVFDTLLDETMILGTAIGLSLQGFLPIPEIQFLAYYHNAQDQIRGEASIMSFYSGGQYANPMVIRIASFAYQKGFGGHFHNDNSIAALRDLPGVVIAAPSSGSDAAKMMRTCVIAVFNINKPL